MKSFSALSCMVFLALGVPSFAQESKAVADLTRPQIDTLDPGAHARSGGDLFAPYVHRPAPVVIDELPTPQNQAGIRLRRVVFHSEVEGQPDGDGISQVYAVIASPLTPGPHPGLLVLHGGKGNAEEAKAIAWAKRGYVAGALTERDARKE